MPWTFAHPAAVLPLRRFCPAPLNFTALVIGSISPDLGYHLYRKDLALLGHSLQGSLLVCLPAGLLVLALLCLMRRPLWYLLPEPHRTAFSPLVVERLSIGPAAVFAAGVSIVLGAWTHIAWDALTHGNGWIVLRVPLLQAPLFRLGGYLFPVHHVLQHLSSYLGAAILVAAYRRWLRRAPLRVAGIQPEDIPRRRLIIACMAIAAAAGTSFGLAAAARYNGYWAWRVFLYFGAVDGVSVFAALYVSAAMIFYWMRRAAQDGLQAQKERP